MYWCRVATIDQTTEWIPDLSSPHSWDYPAGARQYPLIIAHRGDVSSAPENTLPAFQSACESGADGIELDVRLTSDGQLVVFHDRSLKRIGGVGRLVTNASLDEIRSLDVGGWFGPQFRGLQAPTLDEVFDLLPPDYLINVEMKAVIDGMRLIAHRVAKVVRRHQRWNSTLVASFNPISLWELRKIEPRIMRGYIWSRRHPPPIRSRCFSRLVRAHWYDPAHDSYNPRLMRNMRRRGVRTLAWDVDFGRDLARMAKARLDAVVTDNLPCLLQQRKGVAIIALA
jgi:glycerophosphoryl diester phosphodiesterase